MGHTDNAVEISTGAFSVQFHVINSKEIPHYQTSHVFELPSSSLIPRPKNSGPLVHIEFECYVLPSYCMVFETRDICKYVNCGCSCSVL